MSMTSVLQSVEQFQLREAISLRLGVNIESVLLYREQSEFLTELLKNFYTPSCRLLAAAPRIPEIAIAADSADVKLIDVYLDQPFVGDFQPIAKCLESARDMVYLANPNRMSSVTYATSQLKELASKISQGLLIIDEYYHDFSKISAISLLKTCQNLIILRPFESWITAGQIEAGFTLISAGLAHNIEYASQQISLDRLTARKGFEIFCSENSTRKQTGQIQAMSLQLATALSRWGVRCQVCPSNFILIEVNNPAAVQCLLAERNLKVMRLGGDNQLEKYLRFQISTPDKNGQLIEAFSQMPQFLLNSPGKEFNRLEKKAVIGSDIEKTMVG